MSSGSSPAVAITAGEFHTCAVLADSTWAAMQARKALKVEWDDTGFEHLSTTALYNRMKEDVKKPPAQGLLPESNLLLSRAHLP